MKKRPQNNPPFNGFAQANTTPVPDVLFDELLADLSGAELKVLLYIIRRTAGFKKTTDAISLSQFEKGIVKIDGTVLDRGCGLSRESICKALDSLEKRGCIKSEKQADEYGRKGTTVYSIRFKGDVVGKSDQVVGKSDHQNGSQKIRPYSQKNRNSVVGKSDIQETVIQQTERKNGTVNSANPNSSLSSIPSSSSSQEKELSTVNVNNCLPDVEKQSAHRDTEPLPRKLNPEVIRVFGLLCEVFYAIPPEVITPKIESQCTALAPHVRNTEDLKSLRDFTRSEIMDDPSYKKKQVHLGNLVKCVNGWKQKQTPAPEKQQAKKKTTMTNDEWVASLKAPVW